MNFPLMLLGNSMERHLSEEYCDQDWRLRLENSYFYTTALTEEPLTD